MNAEEREGLRSERDQVPVLRFGVRVVVVDAAARVLLSASTDDDGRRFWYPPGGGAEPGEDAAATARRELREEVGRDDIALGPELGRRRHLVAWGGVAYECRERWFLARVPAFEIDTGGFTADERASIDGHRWWTVDELEATADRLVPGNLAHLVRGVLRDGPPTQPIDIGN